MIKALFLVLLVASATCITVTTKTSVSHNGLINSNKLTGGEIIPRGKTTIAKPELSLCPLCVNFMDESINALLNIILQGGVIGSCGALCGQLKNSIEATVCNLLCDYVGVTEFMKLIQDADPDPIWLCEELHVCPVCVGAANITSVTVNPPSGPTGSTFDIAMEFTVTKTLCTGEIAVQINPPASSGAFPFGTGNLVTGINVGSYGVKMQLQAQPSQQEPFSAGKYGVEFAICAGTCGSIHSHSITYALGKGQFVITQ